MDISALISERYKNRPDAGQHLAAFVRMAKAADNAIDLTLGDPDIHTPEVITKAAFSDVLRGHTHYTRLGGYDELIDGIRSYYDTRYHKQYDSNEIVCTAGGCFALYAVFHTLINPGDEVIIPSPYFMPYADQVILNGGIPVFLPTREEDAFCPMPQALRGLINKKTKCIILNSPNNPTGAVYPASLLQEIAGIAERHGLVIVSDEVYDGFSFGEAFTHMASLYPQKTITIGSFSKNFAMAGWRIGYVLAPPIIIGAVKDFLEATTYSAPSPSQRAAIYAIRHHERLIPGITSVFSERLDFAWERLRDIPGIHLSRPLGGMYVFPCIGESGLGAVDFCYALLRQQGVVALPGNVFGEAGERYIRIAVTVDLPRLRVALDRLGLFMAERMKRETGVND